MGAVVRVAILADTHGHLDERVAAAVAACDFAVHAGDVGSGAVLAALRPRRRLVAVHGNNDVAHKWPGGDLALLHALPAEARLALPGGTLAVVHGDRTGPARTRHDWLRSRYPEARCIVYGHSHRLCVERTGRVWIVNPGAAGRARTFGGPSCCVLTASERRWSVRARRFAAAPR